MTEDELAKLLREIHAASIAELLRRIKAGDATSQDLALAWKILQDNGVPLADLKEAVDKEVEKQSPLLAELPFTDSGPIAKIG